MNDWFEDDEKFRVNFEITAWGKTHSINATYDNDVNWSEIMNDITKVVQASYGYAFESEDAEIGIYYPGKKDA